MKNNIEEQTQAVLNELVVVAGDPGATLDDVRLRMEQIYQTADETQQQAIVTVWERVNALHQQTGAAVSLAATARMVAHEMQQQRDYAVEEWERANEGKQAAVRDYEDLQDAIRTMDFYHPDVAELLEGVKEMAYDNIMQSGNYITECPACDITDHGEIPVAHDVALMFHTIITGEEDGGSEGLRQKIADMMIEIVNLYNAEMEERKAAS